MISAWGRPSPDRTLAGRGEGAAGLSRWLRRGHRRQGWLSPPDHAPGTTEPFAGPFSFPHPHLPHGQTTGLGGEEGTPLLQLSEKRKDPPKLTTFTITHSNIIKSSFFFFFLTFPLLLNRQKGELGTFWFLEQKPHARVLMASPRVKCSLESN